MGCCGFSFNGRCGLFLRLLLQRLFVFNCSDNSRYLKVRILIIQYSRVTFWNFSTVTPCNTNEILHLESGKGEVAKMYLPLIVNSLDITHIKSERASEKKVHLNLTRLTFFSRVFHKDVDGIRLSFVQSKKLIGN